MNVPSRSHRAESGMTLVEILVALSILGIAVVSIVSSMASASKASDEHRKQATADTVVKSFAESIKQKVSVGAYLLCPSVPSSYSSPASGAPAVSSYFRPLPGWAAPTGYSAGVSAVKSWNGTSFSTTCPGTDGGAQLLSLSAWSSDLRDVETLEIVVRKP